MNIMSSMKLCITTYYKKVKEDRGGDRREFKVDQMGYTKKPKRYKLEQSITTSTHIYKLLRKQAKSH